MERFSAWRQAPPFDTLGLHKERKPLCRLRFFLKTPAKVGECRTGRGIRLAPFRSATHPQPPRRGSRFRLDMTARRCDLSCENLCGAAGAAVRSSAPSSVSMASWETHFARRCLAPHPDGGAPFAGANARGRSPLSLAVTTVSFRRKRWG